jgi:release factor glutamine methyltransferase
VTRAEALRAAAARLAAAGVADPVRDARVLLRWAAGLDAATFSAALGEAHGGEEAARFEAAVAARAQRRPVAQIVGRRAFWGRDFHVTPDVLDPRPETETLIAAALAGPPPSRILDLGVGSGCILLTLLAERPQAAGVGVDASAAALAVAARNAAALAVAERATLLRGDWFAPVHGRFDLIVANPPYLSDADMAALQPELAHEPRGALAGGRDGLDPYRIIAAGLPAHLAPGGRALLEIGATQGAPVSALLRAAGLRHVQVTADMDGRPRIVSGARD